MVTTRTNQETYLSTDFYPPSIPSLKQLATMLFPFNHRSHAIFPSPPSPPTSTLVFNNLHITVPTSLINREYRLQPNNHRYLVASRVSLERAIQRFLNSPEEEKIRTYRFFCQDVARLYNEHDPRVILILWSHCHYQVRNADSYLHSVWQRD